MEMNSLFGLVQELSEVDITISGCSYVRKECDLGSGLIFPPPLYALLPIICSPCSVDYSPSPRSRNVLISPRLRTKFPPRSIHPFLRSEAGLSHPPSSERPSLSRRLFHRASLSLGTHTLTRPPIHSCAYTFLGQQQSQGRGGNSKSREMEGTVFVAY